MDSSTITVQDGINFFYLDSGPPPGAVAYNTIVFLHGHTFHGATFKRLVEPARADNIRLILPNRRSYPGTTPYTSEELESLESGKPDRAEVLLNQGIYLALLVDGLIQKHQLHPGKVAVGGWSLGVPFLCAFIRAIAHVDEDSRKRLREHVRCMMFWDPPSTVVGFPIPKNAGTSPLHDPNLLPEQRGPAFAIWVSTYWVHPNLASRDPKDLTYEQPDIPERDPTIKNVTPDIFDPTAGAKGESVFESRGFQAELLENTREAVLDPAVREAWGYPSFWTLLGTAAPWIPIFGAWCVEDLSRTVEDARFYMKSMVIEGGNHFVMWDEPEKTISALIACLEQSGM
ncbi:Alpha/Beta hydrolase protein [Mycena floridula]|nr:Alpha/Beta hydrolase protein [Mycena floridula]